MNADIALQKAVYAALRAEGCAALHVHVHA